MSYVEIYAADLKGDVRFYADVHNSHGGAAFIWHALAEKYKIPASATWASFAPFAFVCDHEGMQKLWKSGHLMSEPDRWLLYMTFDDVAIPQEHVPLTATYLHAFQQEHFHPTLAGLVDHLRTASRDESVRAILFNHTSVNSNPWRGPLGEDDNEMRPYNIDVDSQHWYLTPDTAARMEDEDT